MSAKQQNDNNCCFSRVGRNVRYERLSGASFSFGGSAADFVEEVLQEGHLAVGPLPSRPFSRHEREEAFAVRTDVQILKDAGVRKPFLGP